MELSPVHHAILLKQAGEDSIMHSALINVTKIPVSGGDKPSFLMQFVCDEVQTLRILEAALKYSPNAVPQIMTCINRARSEHAVSIDKDRQFMLPGIVPSVKSKSH